MNEINYNFEQFVKNIKNEDVEKITSYLKGIGIEIVDVSSVTNRDNNTFKLYIDYDNGKGNTIEWYHIDEIIPSNFLKDLYSYQRIADLQSDLWRGIFFFNITDREFRKYKLMKLI